MASNTVDNLTATDISSSLPNADTCATVESAPVVISCGSDITFVGIVDDSTTFDDIRLPISFRTVCGRASSTNKWTYTGDEALYSLAMRFGETIRPIDRGLVVDWEAMEKVYHHAFYNVLQIDPSEQPLLIVEAPLTPKANRIRTASIMVNTFNVPSFLFVQSATMCVYQSRRQTGLVIESGSDVTFTTPCVNGYVISHAIQRRNIGRNQLCQQLKQLLLEQEEGSLQVPSEVHESNVACHIEDIFERFCFVRSGDSRAEDEIILRHRHVMDSVPAAECTEYELSWGGVCSIGDRAKSQAAEVLFDPSVVSSTGGGGEGEAKKSNHEETEKVGLHEMVHSSIYKCETELHSDLFGTVILAGTNTMLPGLGERLKKELEQMMLQEGIIHNVNVRSHPRRRCLGWLGGRSLGINLKAMLITSDEFKECGKVTPEFGE